MDRVVLENSDTERFKEVEPFDVIYFFCLKILKNHANYQKRIESY